MAAIKAIGLDEYMNCLLVQNNVRPAFLIQPADYDEATNKDPITASKVAAISTFFPTLTISIIRGEPLVAKRAYEEKDIQTSQNMGDILGYQCAAEYDYIQTHRDEPSVVIQFIVKFKNGNEKQLMANVCRDDRTFADSVALATRIDEVLKADPLLSIESVTAEKQVIVPIKSILSKLIRSEDLTIDDEHVLRNHIGNLIFNDDGRLFRYEYEFKNPVHRGILISLLSYIDNDPMEPFYPLQYHEEHRAVDKKVLEWGAELLRVLNETRMVKKGGKTKKNRGRK